jgi:site-specific recombinase XerD
MQNYETSIPKRKVGRKDQTKNGYEDMPLLFKKQTHQKICHIEVDTAKSDRHESNLMDDVILDFILSKKAQNLTLRTIEWYSDMLSRMMIFFKQHGACAPKEITTQLIRQLLSDLVTEGLSSAYIHAHARVLRTFTRFLISEGYIDEKIDFEMPLLRKRKQRVYSEVEISRVLNGCKTKRERAFLMFMVDSGVRLGEVLALNWGDLDFSTGIIRINNGKGQKFRTVVVGIETQRALVKYRCEVDASDDMPLFQTIHGKRFTESGLRSWLRRLSNRVGVDITPHALRRTFATMALKAGMDLIRLQQLMGHADLDTTRQYIQVLDVDLIEAHKNHSPIEYILKGNKNN